MLKISSEDFNPHKFSFIIVQGREWKFSRSTISMKTEDIHIVSIFRFLGRQRGKVVSKGKG